MDVPLGALNLVCSKCTRQKLFRAPTKFEAGKLALKAGWVMDGDKMVCPKCPAVRSEKYGLPSAADLDAVAAEQKAKETTEGDGGEVARQVAEHFRRFQDILDQTPVLPPPRIVQDSGEFPKAMERKP